MSSPASQLLSGVFSFLLVPCLSSPPYAVPSFKKKMTCFFNLLLILMIEFYGHNLQLYFRNSSLNIKIINLSRHVSN